MVNNPPWACRGACIPKAWVNNGYAECVDGRDENVKGIHCVGWVRLRGPVIQANGRLIFEDDLRSGGLLGFTTQ